MAPSTNQGTVFRESGFLDREHGVSLELLPANCRGLGASVDLAWQMMITDVHGTDSGYA